MKKLLSVTLLMFPALAIASNTYDATVVRVIDGDTVVVRTQIWPGIVAEHVHVRLDGINSPEIHTHKECEKAAGLKAKEFVASLLPAGTKVQLSHVKKGKFAGRILGQISANGQDIGAAELAAGLAREYHGGHRRRWCH